MLSKLSLVAVSGLAVLAAATPTGTGGGTSQCNTGSPQCCQSVSSSSDPSTSALLALLGIVVQGLNVPIGLTCSPLSVIGVGGGSSCNQNPVCCSDIQSKSLIGINCVPINISL